MGEKITKHADNTLNVPDMEKYTSWLDDQVRLDVVGQ
jgi:hypothetical protein